MDKILQILPQAIRDYVQSIPETSRQQIEEIRLRVGQPIEVITEGRPYQHDHDKQNVIFSQKEAQELIHQLSEYSLYTMEEELRRGYVTVRGGHRIGLSGHVITSKGQVKLIRDITSFNIRIAREKIGVGLPLLPYLYEKDRFQSTLIIGSPQTGKTTLLRDLARLISQGVEQHHILSKKVGIVDERSEIAGCVKGVPQNELGQRADVLDACPKAEGMMMMIRSMSPDVLIVDEIGRKEDSDALQEAINAGVAVIATAHATDFRQLLKRPTILPLIQAGIFDRFVELSHRHSSVNRLGRIQRLLDSTGTAIHWLGDKSP